jgi:hypothetical protein
MSGKLLDCPRRRATHRYARRAAFRIIAWTTFSAARRGISLPDLNLGLRVQVVRTWNVKPGTTSCEWLPLRHVHA